MQIDMHFYATYAMARAAGLPAAIANTVATAAQFVDEATGDDPILVPEGPFYVPVATAREMTDLDNLSTRDQWRVWLSFHFLPGNRGATSLERLMCRPGDEQNACANAIISYALDKLGRPYGAHVLGIVTHVLQDTFSHAGFLGIASAYNDIIQESIDISSITNPAVHESKANVLGALAQRINAPGHAAAGEFPDLPYLRWSFEYAASLDDCPRSGGGATFVRNNAEAFLAALERQYSFYRKVCERAPASWQCQGPNKEFAEFRGEIASILSMEANRTARGQAWQEAIERCAFCDTEPADNALVYLGQAWQPANIAPDGLGQQSDAARYIQAARKYLAFVHAELLPGLLPA